VFRSLLKTAVVLVLFFGSTIGLLGGVSLVEKSFAASDSGEFFSSNRNAKRCLFRANEFHDSKSRSFLKTKNMFTVRLTVGQTSEGFGASQATAYKARLM
jgi:HAE1 family hydrophobic/amphiphilic exporter-1